MSPTPQRAYFERRHDEQSTAIEHIQQATSPPAIPPTAAMDPYSNTVMSSAAASQETTSPANQGLASGTKLGLAMIPVVIALVGLYILFLFWYRKRRAARRIEPIRRPTVPEKDIYSYNDSFDSGPRTSKVHNMNAFSTPIHDQNCRAQLYAQKHAGQAVPERSKTNFSMKRDMAAPPRSPHMVEVEMDSPIDATSPFRLKRGDTVKRSSLGPDLARLWPSPPPSAWIKPAAL